LVDFINEVEEELRKDKYNELLRKYGPYIVGLIIGVVAVAGYLEFQKYTTGVKARKTSASFVAADKLAEDGDLQAAISKFTALAEVAPEGYAGLSYSRAAGIKVQLGDMAGAVSLFDKSAEVFEKPMHKDLARLKAAYILLDEDRYDDVKARAQELMIENAPYSDLAREMLAHAELQSGNEDGARTQFTYLANVPGVLDGVKTRAGQSLLLLNANRVVPVPEPVIEAPDIVEPLIESPDEQTEAPVEDPQ